MDCRAKTPYRESKITEKHNCTTNRHSKSNPTAVLKKSPQRGKKEQAFISVCMYDMSAPRKVQRTDTVGNPPVETQADGKRCNILLAARAGNIVEPKSFRINVISSTNKTEYEKSQKIVKILISENSDQWKTKLAADQYIEDIISLTNLTDSTKKNVIKQFCSCPPPFVNQKHGISLENYVKFIQEVVKATKKSKKPQKSSGTDSNTDTGHSDACEALASCFEHLKDGVQAILAHADTSVILEGKSMKYKAAITKQLRSFISTLVYCLVHDDALEQPDPTINLEKWQQPIIDEKMNISGLSRLEEKDYSARSIIDLLEKRKMPSDKERNLAFKLLAEQLNTIIVKEEKNISDSEKKSKYNDLGATIALEFIKNCFHQKLTNRNTSGIAAVKVIIKDAYDSSVLLEVLEYVWNCTSKIPANMDISEALKLEDDIPVSIVEPTYETRLIEPPTFSVKFKFQPPVYDTSRNWINFIELSVIPYFLRHELSYSNRAAALWHCLPSVNFRNRYMKTFGPFITSNTIRSREDFENLYRKVGETFWPEQTLLPHDYEKLLNKPGFVRQKTDETHSDFADRLKRTFKAAYPSTYDSDTNKLKLCELTFKGLKDTWLRHLLFKEHFETIFEKGEINKMIALMDREKIKYHKAKKLAREGLSLNYIDVNSSVSVSPVYSNNFPRNNGYKSDRQNRQKFHKPDKTDRKSAAIQREFEFLCRGRNLGSNGKLIVPMNKIPDRVRHSKNFNPKNYVQPEKYSSVRKMAEANVTKRWEERHKKASNTRKYRRKVENKQRRTNILIEPYREDTH